MKMVKSMKIGGFMNIQNDYQFSWIIFLGLFIHHEFYKKHETDFIITILSKKSLI